MHTLCVLCVSIWEQVALVVGEKHRWTFVPVPVLAIYMYVMPCPNASKDKITDKYLNK